MAIKIFDGPIKNYLKKQVFNISNLFDISLKKRLTAKIRVIKVDSTHRQDFLYYVFENLRSNHFGSMKFEFEKFENNICLISEVFRPRKQKFENNEQNNKIYQTVLVNLLIIQKSSE
jgi:hypothetical protein